MKRTLRILHLEDDLKDAELVREMLVSEGITCDVLRVDSQAAFLDALEQNGFDLIFADYSLPAFDGISALKIAKEKSPDTPFIFITGKMGEDRAIETLKNGATDYILKDNLSKLVPAVSRALQELREKLEHKRADEELRESQKKLRHLSSELLTAQERERKRIAGELHDSVAASLGAIIFSIEKILGQAERDEGTKAGLKDLISRVQQVNEEARRIMSDLRPSLLDDLGIVPAMNWFCREYERTYAHIRMEKQIELSESDLTDSLKTAIFRISQEALNNTAKHSKADRVHLSLRRTANRIELTVKDNGEGFDLEEAFSASNPRKGLGLASMRERTELTGGSFVIESFAGAGTRIHASWPSGEEWNRVDEDLAPVFSAKKTTSGEPPLFKTLLVEDNVSFRRLFKETLQTRFPSMVIEEVADGNDVLEKVHAFLPRLIFMDIQLPGKNGLQLTKEIKSAYPDIVIVVMTSYNILEYRNLALQYGVHRFMVKDSLNLEEIEALIKSFPLPPL